jgi:hypothetical protein
MAGHPLGVTTRGPTTYRGWQPSYGYAAQRPSAFWDDWAAPLPWDQSGRAAEPVPHDPVAADLRNQVVDRLRRMNVLHARHAWERRNRDPLGPHSVAFFYAEPSASEPPSRGRYPHGKQHHDELPRAVLRTATRMFLDGPEVADLPRLLYDLTSIAKVYLGQNYFDPRAQMCDRVERMSRHAGYLGLGVSTLDTPAGRWADVRQAASSELDVPGRCLALLADTTMLLLDRGAEEQFGVFRICSTHSLDVVPLQRWRTWQWAPDLPDLRDPLTRHIWYWLGQLHRVAGGAGRDR